MFHLKATLTALMAIFGVSSALALESPHFVVFDLDRTLIQPNPRIAGILANIGRELSIPSLVGLSPEAITRLVSGDRSALGINDPLLLQRIFGNYRDGSHRTSEFGRRFYFDSSYLELDEAIPGASDFVNRIDRESDARILYLSGRIQEYFEEATWKQLEHFGFPGRDRATLILKPLRETLGNDEYKVRALGELKGSTIAIFDDSSRNLGRFAENLIPRPLLVRVSTSALPQHGDAAIRRINHYLDQTALLDQILTLSKGCGSYLLPGN
jgi:hypothetical protein